MCLLTSSVPVNRWSQVRIIRAAPIISLLSNQLQSRLSELYQSLLTYQPTTLDNLTSGDYSFDDNLHALKSITSVTICCGSYINSIFVAYLDGTCSGKHGGTKGASNVFTLGQGKPDYCYGITFRPLQTWR
jgi:hypothetical protein